MPLIYDAEYVQEISKIEEQIKNDNYKYFRFLMPVGHMLLAGLVAWVLSVFGMSEIAATIMGSCMAIVSAIAWLTYEVKYELVLNLAVAEWVGRKRLGEYRKPGST